MQSHMGIFCLISIMLKLGLKTDIEIFYLSGSVLAVKCLYYRLHSYVLRCA